MDALYIQFVLTFGEWNWGEPGLWGRACGGDNAMVDWKKMELWTFCVHVLQDNANNMVGGYMIPCAFHGRQYGTSENTDRNISPGELSALSFLGSTREFNWVRVCFNIMHYV